MASVTLYNDKGESVGKIDLDPTLFDVAVKAELVHEAVVAQRGNSRDAIAHTKDRSEVRGGGRKPWKQKGTGRARHGSSRSPLWSGGGITFGPRSNRNFSKKMNRKARRKALAMVLTDKVTSERFTAIDALTAENGKTTILLKTLGNLPNAGKKTLILVETVNRDVSRAAGNISNVETLPVNALNIVDLLSFDHVLASKAALEQMTEVYKR